MAVEDRIRDLGLTVPSPPVNPPGVEIPFEWVRVHGDRAYVSGHGALDPEGRPVGPFGQVPSEVTLEQAQASAQLAGLAIIASLRHAIGDLERITAWLTVSGFVNAEPGYAKTTAVLNPVSDLLLAAFGESVGRHARTAIGVAALPLNLPVVIGAEVEIRR